MRGHKWYTLSTSLISFHGTCLMMIGHVLVACSVSGPAASKLTLHWGEDLVAVLPTCACTVHPICGPAVPGASICHLSSARFPAALGRQAKHSHHEFHSPTNCALCRGRVGWCDNHSVGIPTRQCICRSSQTNTCSCFDNRRRR